MSSFRNPVGSEPHGVYWRRRLIALGAVLVVVIVVVLIVVGRGGGPSEAVATDAASASRPPASTRATAEGAAPSAPAASTGATAGATAGSTPGVTTPATKAAAGCQRTQIVLKPLTNQTSYAPTEQPAIAMSITNTGSHSCHMDLGSRQQVLTITSGAETYWTSKDCQTGGTSQDVTLKAGQTLTTPAITWDRTRSSTTTCDSSRSSVPASGASYHLAVSVGSLKSSASAQFVLN